MKPWLWALALSACAPDDIDATAIVVSVKSELELRELDYRVFREIADLSSEAPLSSVTVGADQIARPFVIVRGVAEQFLISIEGYTDRSQGPAITYQAHVRFVPEQTLALRVLLASICYQRDCGFRGLTCYGQSWAGMPAGSCAVVPMPELLRITYPGEESEW
jgi:hypothetical protein